MTDSDRKTVVLSVNQDAGIGPGRNKGAAVHLNAMRAAFSGLGADCQSLDEPDDAKLASSLLAAFQSGPVDLIYERYALGKSAAAHFAAEHNIPLVMEVNSPLADEQQRWRGGSNQGEDARNDAFAMAEACKVIAVSSDVARYAKARGAHPDRVEIFPNGIDVDRFNPGLRDEAFRRSLIPEGRFVIGFHGRERPWHGFERLTSTVGQLLARGHNVHLLVVGKGDFNSLGRLPADRYTRIGWQPHELMPGYVAIFDALPLTYQSDMPCYFSPLKLMEAMGCGVVPVVPGLGDLADVVNHGKTGLVFKAGDEEQLLQHLESLITDRDLLETIGRQAAIEARQHSWASIAEHVLESTVQKGGKNSGEVLQLAFRKLKNVNLGVDLVRRVAIERAGAIHIEVHQADKQRFFLYDDNQFQELQVGQDAKIPLVKNLKDRGFASAHTIISYRPGRRIVLDCTGGTQAGIIKAYKKRKTALAAEKYKLVQAACASGGFDIPDLIQTNTNDEYLLIEKRVGCAPVIDTDAVETWSQIGACLRRFQQSGIGDDLQAFNHLEELEVLNERARRLLLCTPALPNGWLEGRQRLQEATMYLPSAKTGLAHRDLHDRQFIVSDETISLLDFDLVCLADVALDAANLLVHMKLRILQAGHDDEETALRACSDAFISGLDRQDEPGFVSRLYFYQGSTYYRLALLYAIRPRWAHLTDRLIAEGNACMSAFDRTRGDL